MAKKRSVFTKEQERIIKKFKKNPEITNPFALARWMTSKKKRKKP